MRQFAAVLIAAVGLTQGSVTGQSTDTGKRVKTSKGTFTVPGIAYADGRDLEAQPPLTVMKINAWESTKRLMKLCEVPHGREVALLAAEEVKSEERYYFKVRWVPEVFLSHRRQRVVGTREF